MRWLLNGMLDNEAGPLAYCLDESALMSAALGKAFEPRRGLLESFHAPEGEDTNNPAAVGWLLIVPDDDEGTQIASKLAPLVEHRCRMRGAGGDRHPQTGVIKRLPLSATAPALLGAWVEREIVFAADPGSYPPEYILVAGPPAKLPLELNHQLHLHGQRVGRLAFPNLQSYADYAAKVIAWEPDSDFARTPRTGLPVHIFATDAGPRDATRQSRLFLAEPVRDWLATKSTSVFAHIRDGATREALLKTLRSEGPRLLFSCTHGLAVSGSGMIDARRQRQGAIVCQDAALLGDEELLTAEALGDGTALRGGIWLMFACFGAGTPLPNEFINAIAEPTLLGLHEGGPFLAELPTRMLANPDGPLAILGHLDPSFVHAFSGPTGPVGQRKAALLSLIANLLLRGIRIGGCVGELSSDAALFSLQVHQLTESVAREIGSGDVSKVAAAIATAAPDSPWDAIRSRLVDMTISHYEFRNFIILGDPAVKLPHPALAPSGPTATQAAAVAPAATAPAAAQASTDAERAVAPVEAKRASGQTFTAAETAVDLPAALVEAKRDSRLVFTCLEHIFSEAGVALPAGESLVVSLVAEPCADVRNRPAPSEPKPDGTKSQFYESVEHQDCDLLAVIRLSPQAAWPAPAYRIPIANGTRLRYGEIISLSGDFFGIPGHQVADGDATFLQIFATLENSDKEELRKILSAMGTERATVEEAQGAGSSVTDAYRRVGNDLNGAYNRATGGGSFIHSLLPQGRYLKLARVNYDHFGHDAVKAYRVAHGVACRTAKQARAAATADAQQQGLLRAYAMNACSDHFLTDLFAAGHLRVPRHELSTQIAVDLIGALLAKRMHDEDNARGLKVRNRQGREWTAYGDQHFHDTINEVGRRIAREAVRASAAEVWAAFNTGAEPAFLALEMVPDVDNAMTRSDNHTALFIVQDGVLKRREDLRDPQCNKWTTNYTGIGTLLRGAVDDLVARHSHGG